MTFRFKRDAEAYERKMKGEQEEIRRGLRGLPPLPKPFEVLCVYWIDNRASQKRSGSHDESIIRAHLRPAFGAFMLHEIGVEQIDKFIVDRSHLNKKTVNNHLTLLGSMLNAAKDIGWLAVVPRIRKPKVRVFGNDFSYLRTDEEVRTFLVAANEENAKVFTFYATAVYTGMRAGELAGLHWGDVNFERRLITVQRSFAGPTKAEDVRYVPILDPLLPLLRERRLADGAPSLSRAGACSCCERRVGQRVEQPGERRPRAHLVVEAHEAAPVVEQDDVALSAVVTFGGEDLSREPSHVREPGHVAPTSPGSAMTDVDATPCGVFGDVHRAANLAPVGCPFGRDVRHGWQRPQPVGGAPRRSSGGVARGRHGRNWHFVGNVVECGRS